MAASRSAILIEVMGMSEAATSRAPLKGVFAVELDVHRNRARPIAFEFGFYKRVREVWRDRERAQLTATGWFAFVAVCVLTLGVAAAISTGVILP
jgi:hypothetical protein